MNRTEHRAMLLIILSCALSHLDGLAWGQEAPAMRSLEPPVLLPDGKPFLTWEQPVRFDRTYYVDGASPAASDKNPGTEDRPFATINRAAEVLQPGERVVVAAGVYREWVRPQRGGSGPDRIISYEAAPGATVIIKGSREFKPQWQPSNATSAAGVALWQAKLDPTLFDGYNPFNIDNVTPEQFATMDWATPLKGKVPYTLPRGLVFHDGKLLRQVAEPAGLLAAAGTYLIDRPAQILHVRLLGDQNPGQAHIEITTQETVFAPVQAGLGYIRVKGFTIEHAAGPFPWEQVGAISTTRGHHWIIEDNTVRWANGVGMDLGTQHPRRPQPPVVGFHIVRRNIVTDCGICGICGLGPARGRDFGLLIEDNILQRNAFYDVERLFETGAIKTHNNIRCLIRRNLITDTSHGAGIWMDWNNQFSRCTQNVIVNTQTIHGAIFMEASYQPNLVDQNLIWKTDGHGIYEHDSTGQIFVHNLIADSSKSGLHLHGRITDRRVDGRAMVYGRHVARNNMLIRNAKADYFGGEPSDAADNLTEGVTATLDALAMTVSWSIPAAGMSCKPVPGITHDFFGNLRKGQEVPVGPFAKPVGSAQKLPFWTGLGEPVRNPAQVPSPASRPRGEARQAPVSYEERVQSVARTPGFVALWDFVKREPGGGKRFTAHVPPGATNDFALDAANYVKDYWGEGREATYADFPLLGRGPFGQAIRIRKEEDATFRPLLFVPRSRLHDSPLDIKGEGKSVTVVVWAIRESGNHALAGIWHEGTDLKQDSTANIRKVERGQRQYALFAGLNKEGSACGHVSENGASSFLNRYALHKCNSADVSPAVPADSPDEVLDASWQCFAMTFDHQSHELTGWLNGKAGDRWLENPKNDKLISSAYNAWLQGHLHREPGLQDGEDPNFAKDQFYNPPEDKPTSVKVLSETAGERVELQEFRYTRVKVTLRKGADGSLTVAARDLVALRLNPWWYPHGIYSPKDASTGGPFTIGRVIHSSRGVGFTGWIGGVAVFNRALDADEVGRLAQIGREKPIFSLPRVPEDLR